jgi:alpha-1,6-mannosyltransferase
MATTGRPVHNRTLLAPIPDIRSGTVTSAKPFEAPLSPAERDRLSAADKRARTSRGSGRLQGAHSRASAVAVVALAVLTALSLLLVIIAADRPSFLASGTWPGFFPAWLVGPLQGLWPQLHPSPMTLMYLVSAVMVAMFCCYVVALRFSDHLRPRWLLATIVALHVVFFLSPPLQYTDVFNYINYGRMAVVHHLDPYVVTPLLEPHADPSFALSNWHGLLSPYGPLFTQLTEALVPLGVPASFWALKLLDGLASLGTLVLVWHTARWLGRRPAYAVAFAGLNPLVLVWGLGAVHYDSIMMLFLVLAMYLVVRSRRACDAPRSIRRLEFGAGAALAVAVAIKVSAGIVIPIFLLSARSRRTLAGMICTAAVLAAASFASFGAHGPSLAAQSTMINVRGLPDVLGYALGLGGETRWLHTAFTVGLIAAVALCSAWAWRSPEQWLTAAGTLMLALVLSLSWSVPWYVLWILPFAGLSRSRRLTATVLVLSAYFLLSFMPAEPDLANRVGFHPQSTAIGRAAGRAVSSLGG